MSTIEEEIATSTPEATERVAGSLAPGLQAGDCILLSGDLGGGKTTFTRGLVRGLGHPDPREVTSPTFALHHRYEGGRLVVDHLDLYRLEKGPEMLVQGVLDPLEDPATVCVVEWAERLPDPGEPALLVTFTFRGERERSLQLAFRGKRGRRLHEVWTARGGKR